MPFQNYPKKMLKIILRIILTGFFLLSGWNEGPLQAQEGGEVKAVLAQLKNRFSAVKGFQAEYVRDIVPNIPSQLPSAALQAQGRLFFRSPAKLRMEQHKPRQEQLISNGVRVWWYIPEEKTVTIYRLKDYYVQIKPIMTFLAGLGDLDKEFSVRLENPGSGEAGYYQLLLKPRNPQPDLNQIMVRISKTDYFPLEFTIKNLMGDGTRFRFSQVQTGGSFPSKRFEFIPPKGTRVISQPPVLPSTK
ncbi:MAG: outer membrane lipoprotein carrier protein LolA [Thermodesulfobacteriota bacterium]